jgi:hypothetical protein
MTKARLLALQTTETKFKSPMSQIVALIQELTELPVCNEDTYQDFELSEDVVIVFAGTLIFASKEWRDNVFSLLSRARCVIFITNDYRKEPPSQMMAALRGRNVDLRVWSTFQPQITARKKRWIGWRWTQVMWNWNTYEVVDRPLTGRADGLLYYGRMREGRNFDLLRKGVPYPVHVSCSIRALEAWASWNPSLRYHPEFRSAEDLAVFQTSLYLEDEFSHSVYTGVANRFFECMAAGVGVVAHVSCRSTFEREGIEDMVYVATPDDVLRAKPYLKNSFDWRGDLHVTIGDLLAHQFFTYLPDY